MNWLDRFEKSLPTLPTYTMTITRYVDGEMKSSDKISEEDIIGMKNTLISDGWTLLSEGTEFFHFSFKNELLIIKLH